MESPPPVWPGNQRHPHSVPPAAPTVTHLLSIRFLHGHGGAFRMCNSEIDSKIKNDQKQEEAQQHHHANHRPHLVPWHKRARASATQNSAPVYFRMNTPLGSALNGPRRWHRKPRLCGWLITLLLDSEQFLLI
ncbi:uncharacterized protein LOC120423081 [Culex pipiens pallens]|uniref:uncharacterized protein LOC120423081 n=1 Tax=Culex pipiens pallens TaxID=42434 RepID=UPI0019542BE8|nr:uncharacterized protein LOC120423081 [Culex pipiens pallens]